MNRHPRDAPPIGDKNSGMRRDARAAAIGGLAATFVVAAAFLPRMISGGGDVRFHQTAADSTVTTDTAAPPDTSTTAAPTTTTVAPTTSTTVRPTTTTTVAPSTTTTSAPIAPNVGAMQMVPEGVSLYFYNHSPAVFPSPAVRLRVTGADGQTQEIVTPLPDQDHGRMTIPAPGALSGTVVDTEWTGGVLAGGA